MSGIIKNLLTANDLLRLADDGLRHELINGELKSMTPSGSEHSRATSSICAALDPFIARNDLGWSFGAEGGFILSSNPDTVRAPDFAFVAKARVPRQGPVEGYFPGAPDLAVEVLSPNDRAQEVEDKVQQWLDAGTRQVWVVNARRRSLTIHAKGKPSLRLGATDVVDGGDLLPGLRVRVEELLPAVG